MKSVPLGDVVDILDNMRVPINSAERAKRQGSVPYYGATGQVGTIDKAIFNETLILLGEDGVPFFDSSKRKAYEISGPSWVNNHAHVLRAKSELIIQRYLLHFLNGFNYSGYVNGATRLKLTQGDMKRIPIPLPSVEKQREIVEKLDSAFAEIDLLEANLSVLENYCEELLYSIQRDLFSSNFKVVFIGDICKLMTGGTPSRSRPEYFLNGNIKWLVSGDIHQGEIYDCEGRITSEAMKSSNTKILPLNSVMIALNGQGKTRASVALLRTEATCNQSLVSISPIKNKELLSEFLFHNLKMRYQELRRMTGDDGNDRRGLNMILIRDIEIPLPSLEKQHEIVDKLDFAFIEIESLKRRINTEMEFSSSLRKSLLSNSFTQVEVFA